MDSRLVVGALCDLLSADRMTVEAILAVARLVLGPEASSNELEQGSQALEQALDAWRNGHPVSAVAHFEQAADRVFDLLGATASPTTAATATATAFPTCSRCARVRARYEATRTAMV